MAVNKVVYGSETLIDLTEDTVTADAVADGYSVHLASGVRTTGTAKYAASPVANGNAVRTNGILYGEVDTTSTSTVFTATIDGVTGYYNGLTILLYNGVVTSASGFTININGLGAYGSYSNMALGNDVAPTEPSRDTTIFKIDYAMLFVFSTNIGGDGVTGWICYRGYDANTNTVGYQLRTNSTVMTVTDTARYYKLYFTSANGKQWVPASVNSKNDATTARAVNQRPIDPFGRIVYTSASTSYTAGSNLAATSIWTQYALVLGYSFNVNGGNLTLTTKTPVYLKCAPQSNGSAIMDATTPIVQALPSTEDGKIYIYLGVAYDATHIELYAEHPVYYYKDGAIRLWTNAAAGLTSVDWDDVENKPTFATVATSGSYNDLSNKPTIPTVPTNVSSFTNDAGYLTSSTGVTSVNGSHGAVTVPTLPTVSASDNDKVLTVVNGAWAAAEASGGGTPLTDQEIEDAVDSQFMTVTIMLTNPVSTGSFISFTIYYVSNEYDTYWEAYANKGEAVAHIDSPTGSVQFNFDPSYYGIITEAQGGYVSSGTSTVSGGITLIEDDYEGGCFFAVSGEGTIIQDNIDYND